MTDLHDLAAGRMPPNVVPAVRLEGFGTETYAREPVAALLARHPEGFDDALIVGGRSAACLASQTPDGSALFADLHDGNIVRLWRLGGTVAAIVARQRVAVAADDDLSQLRSPVFFDAADHRELIEPDAIVAAATAAATLDFGLGAPPLRTRVFVRRAFTAGAASAALFGLSVLANGARRQPLAFNVAALCFPGRAPRLIIDRAGLAAAQAAAWIPHL